MEHHTNTWLDHILHLAFRNAITGFAVSLITISFFTTVSLIALTFSGFIDSPYIGILAFIIFPTVFAMGLVILPIGLWVERKRHRAAGTVKEGAPLPRLDLNDPKVRRTAWLVVLLTFINVAVISAASYESVHYMESVAFCGEVCHAPMNPEFLTASDSPHSMVGCVECHVGPGAEGFIKAKMGGVRQLIGFATDSYSKPIPAPVHNMIPAEHSCEECHSPQKDYGEIMRVTTKYAEDEVNTALSTVLMMYVGGPGTEKGIHTYHLDSSRKIEYYTDDETRETIPYVRATTDDGTVTEYILDGSDFDVASLDETKLHTMDCIDCHNRSAHDFELPESAVDAAIRAGRLPMDRPYIKSAAVEALRGAAEEDAGEDFVATHIREYYADDESATPAELDAISEELNRILARNVHPTMNITWGTYPNNIGHTNFTGCFRCHDDTHSSADGNHVISQDCTVCHNVVAWDEEQPDILTTLMP